MGADHAELARLALDPAQRERCQALAGEVFDCFEAWTHELLRYAVAHPARPAAAAAGRRHAIA